MFPPLLAIAVVLAFTLVMAKLPLASPYGPWEGVDNWVAISAEDVALVAGCWLLCSLVHRSLEARPGWQRSWVLGLRAVSSVAALYGVVNIGINAALRQPLNSRVLSMMKHVGDIGSSCLTYLTWQMVVALVGAPALVWWGSAWLARVPVRVPRWRWGFLVFCAAWFAVGACVLSSTPADAWQRRAGRNPHRELLSSLVFDALVERRPDVVGPFPKEHLKDFRLAATRRTEPVAHPPRNVIVYVMESTSAQYLSLYGAQFDTTPNLCAEAAHSLLFERAYAQVGYTFCSYITLAFSVYPGLPWLYRPDGPRPMTKALGGVLAERGYRTAFLAAANPDWGGMDYMAKSAGIREVLGPEQLAPGNQTTSWGCTDGPLVEGLMEWIAKDPSQPFYALAWTDQSHHPYTVTEDIPLVDYTENGGAVEELKNRYLNSIRQADHHLGRLFAFLREKGLDKDTLVVVTGDHGEAFGHPHPMMGHGNGLFDENMRVPLLFWSPALFEGGRREVKPAGHVDVNPTIAHLLGVQPPADWQGCSLLSPEHPGRVYMLSDRDGFQFGVVDGMRKAILYATAGYDQLFDLANDPLELDNLSKKMPEVSAQLRTRISAFIQFEEKYLNGEGPAGTGPKIEKRR